MPRLHRLTAALLLPLAGGVPALAAADALALLAGCHRGDVSDGSAQHPITTRFDGDGSGSYTFDYEGEAVHGDLASCRVADREHLHCRWQDPFGSGDLHVQAEPDGSGFRARWRTDGIHGELDWNGRRIACPAGPE